MTDCLNIQNRKYLGSKFRLLDFLERAIRSQTGAIGTFIDGFSGTGVVAHHFRKFAGRIIANDLLYSNYIINRAFLKTTQDNASPDKLTRLIDGLNQMRPIRGYVYQNFGGTYFSHDNASRIDAVRTRIEDLYRDGICTEQEHCVLLTSLIYAVDKVGNTVGQYDAFLKHLGKESYDDQGKHRIDSNVYKKLHLKVLFLSFGNHCDVYNEDLNSLIHRIKGDVLYLDPPYNGRQYVDCYHVLENIARWEKPPLQGKTKKFERSHLKSRYSRKRECIQALEDLIQNARAKHIFLSYNSEGIIPENVLSTILRKRGKLKVFATSYPVFGNGAGRAVKREIEERLFYCKSA